MTRINLLPPDERSKAAREQGLMLVVLGLIVLVVALGAVYFLSHKQVNDKQQQIDEISAQVDQANLRLAELKPYQTMQSDRQAMQDTAKQVYDSRVIWSNIIEEVSLLVPEHVSLRQVTAAVPDYMIAGGALSAGGSVSTSTTQQDSPDIQLIGDATGADLYQANDEVAEFMSRLGLMPQLMTIKLGSSVAGSALAGSAPDVQFTITAKLRPFAVSPPLAPAAPAIVMGGAQ